MVSASGMMEDENIEYMRSIDGERADSVTDVHDVPEDARAVERFRALRNRRVAAASAK